MDRIEIVLSNILLIVEYFTFLICVLNKKFKFNKIYNSKKLVCLSLLIIIYIISIVLFSSKYLAYLILTFIAVYMAYIFIEKRFFDAVRSCIVAYCFLSLLEGLVNIIFFENVHIDYIKICGCSTTIILMLLIYKLLIGRNLKEFEWSNKLWIMFISVVFMIELMISYFSALLKVYGYDLSDTIIKIGTFVVLLGGIAIYIIIFSMAYYFNQKEDYRVQKEISETLNEQQREYFNKLLENEQSTRKFRHDIINHLLVLRSLEKNNEYKRLKEYIDDMLEDLDNLSHAQYDVGNQIINTIINYYLSAIKDEVKITINGYVSETLNVSQKDICIIVSNLIKNAVEAIAGSDEKKLVFEIAQGNQYLRMMTENTFSGTIKIDKKGNYTTTKPDTLNHGIGLNNVRHVVEKYNGNINITTDKNVFKVEVYLKL